MIDWQKHIIGRPHDLPILDKLQATLIEVIIDAWENICDSVEATIKEEHMACERRWTTARVLLGYLDFPSLDHIVQAPSPKL